MSIVVEQVLGLSTLQDGGRAGYRHEGIPLGGYADPAAARLANRLVGRAAQAPLIECASGLLRLRFGSGGTVAWTGAGASVRVDGITVSAYRRLRLRPGAVLQVSGPYEGRFTYLAVAELGAMPTWRGSVAPLRLGDAWHPSSSVLRVGQCLPLEAGGADVFLTRAVFARVPARPKVLTAEAAPETHLYRPWIAGEYAGLAPLAQVPWRVSRVSDRVGVRLGHGLGARLGRRLPQPPSARSSPTLPGTVQVLPGGHLIVSMADGPTMGGYPRLGVLDEASRGALAQATGVVWLDVA